MKFREHRGSFEDSMQTEVHIKDREQLLQHLKNLLEPWPTAPPVTEDTVRIEPYYGVDPRNGWDTHLVYLKGYGVMGFTDSPG